LFPTTINKVLKKLIIFTFLFLAVINTTFSQTTIKGTVKDSLENPLSYANIQLLDSTKAGLINYSITQGDGSYEIETELYGTFFIKASFMGFEPVIKKLQISEESHIVADFKLMELASALEEVVIKHNYSLADVRKDTIIYNLENLTNGQENNLKEIIKKLPGAEIDENGKVKVNGQQVDKLLIDGDAFFGNQHQLATENITADMVGGITFFEKYRDNTNIEGFESNSTALNITIKERYKNRITGNVEAMGAIENKYLAHTNLFRFGGDFKLTFIGDINNIGKEAISFSDYIELNSGVGQYTNNKNTGIQTRSWDSDDVPVFLQPSLNVANREIQLGALNFTYAPNKKLKISGYSIFNGATQKQFFGIDRYYLNQPNLDQQETKKIFGNFFFNSSMLNSDYKINDKTLLNYTISYNSGKDDEQSFINISGEEENIFGQENTIDRSSLGQQLSLTRKIGSQSLLTLNGLVEFSKTNRNLNLDANRPFLGLDFTSPHFMVNQVKLEEQDKYALNFLWERDIKKGNYTLSGGTTMFEERFSTYLKEGSDSSNFSNDLNRNRFDHYIGLDFFYETTSWLSLSGGLSYHYYIFEDKNEDEIDYKAIFPTAGFVIRFDQLNRLNFTYRYTNSFPELQETINNSFLENYLGIIRGSSIAMNEILPEHNFNLLFSRTKFSSGTSMFLMMNFSKRRNNIILNSLFQPEGYLVREYRFGNSYQRFSTTVSLDKKFRKEKLSLKSQSSYFQSEYDNFINSQLNNVNVYTFQQDLGVHSNYKTAFNFSTGISFVYREYENSVNTVSFSSTQFNPYINFTGYHYEGKFYWSLESTFRSFESNTIKRSFLQINPSLNYVTKNWRFYIEGNNILNLTSPEIAEIINSENFYEERVSKSLEGFMGIGVNYSF
jgi:hypothetical protein